LEYKTLIVLGADWSLCGDKPEVWRGRVLHVATFTHFSMNVRPGENYWGKQCGYARSFGPRFAVLSHNLLCVWESK